MKTELKDRTLWFDGTSEVSPELVPEMLLSGVPIDKIVVTAQNDDILLFNSLADDAISLSKIKNDMLDMSWAIPQKYLDIRLDQYIAGKLAEHYLRQAPKERNPEYSARAKAELIEINLRGLDSLFKTLIYAVDKFKESDTVWGVGRGSSCASLVLYLIGLHKVDPVRFNIPLTEFFHD
jgi:hypothetical protein